MRLPKLRELREAVTAVFSPRYTTRFPATPCQVPPRYRGKPEFDLDNCIGCGACVNACPTEALIQTDDTDADTPTRKITLSPDTCIFCGNCEEVCTTEKGIALSNQWDLATLDRDELRETFDFELQLCEKCGEVLGTKKHLVWLYEKLGPLAYTNPSLLLAKSGDLLAGKKQVSKRKAETEEKPAPDTTDFMRILCPKCKFELNIRL